MKLFDRILVPATATLALLAVATIVRTVPKLDDFFGLPRPAQAVSDWERYLRDAPRLGPENAQVSIVEFIDYTCGACRGFQPTLERILEQNPSDVSIAIRYFPGPESRPAAFAALCADRQGKFPEYHRLLLQVNAFDSEDVETDLRRLAAQAGVRDTIALKSCMASPGVYDALEADTIMALAAGVVGTPSFIVNGQLYRGTQPNLKKLIKKLLAAGNPR
jgi:protein-disulfide isomerase